MFNNCIFCNSATNQLTDEHIVPEFVGGALKVPFVCKPCNDKMGSDFEGSMSRNLLFSIPRHRHGIQGKAKEPIVPIQGIGVTPEGVKVTLDENFEPHVITYVSDSLTPEGAYTVSINVDAEDKDKIPAIIEKKALRYLKRVRPNMPKEEIDAYVSQTLSTIPSDPPIRRSRPALQYQMTFDMDALRFLFLKIAFEIAVYHHGPSYLMDPTAIELREAVRQRKTDIRVRGQIPAANDDLKGLTFRENCHAILLMNDGCYVRLFSTSAIIQVTEEDSRFAHPRVGDSQVQPQALHPAVRLHHRLPGRVAP